MTETFLRMKTFVFPTVLEADKARPALKTAPVFGGIAGIMTAEQGDSGDTGNVPSMSTKTRELGKLQDMYRRTLAASWAAQDGELPADQCIEDIFAGGDGWAKGKTGGNPMSPKPSGGSTDGGDSDGDRRTLKAHEGNSSSGFAKYSPTKPKSHMRTSSKKFNTSDTTSVSGRASIEQQVHSSADEAQPNKLQNLNELNEFTAREDLCSWEIRALY